MCLLVEQMLTLALVGVVGSSSSFYKTWNKDPDDTVLVVKQRQIEVKIDQ